MKKHRFIFSKKLKIYSKIYFKKQFILFLLNNPSVSVRIKQRLVENINKLFKYYSFTKIKKFCTVTGRLRFTAPHSVFSRMTFRDMIRLTWVAGIYKNFR